MGSRLTCALLVLFGLAVPQAVLAEPPAAGSIHTFRDPLSQSGTVFCDGLEQVHAIARANDPDGVYALYRGTPNALNEPICMAMVPTGRVVEVLPLGVMVRNGRNYDTWAIETDIDGTTVFGLYVEQASYIGV